MQKSLGGTVTKVLSAFARDEIRGSVYVEAPSFADVRCILEGIPRVRRLRGKRPCVDIVSLAERPPLLTMGKSISIKSMSWVRLKRYGKYKNDLGFVHEVDSRTLMMIVYVVPRIRLARKRKRNTWDSRQSRPPAALFDAERVAEFYGEKEVQRRNLVFDFKGGIYLSGGLLELTCSPLDVSLTNINPTQPELDLFQASRNELILEALSAGVVSLHIGDRIQVVIGTFTGLSGRLVDIKMDNTVVFETDNAIRHEAYSSEIRKYFKLGDYVGVVQGESSGRQGYIVELSSNSALIYERATTIGEEVRFETNSMLFIDGSELDSLTLICGASTGSVIPRE